jgi:UDP-glucose 4-epimerase
MSTKKMVVTGGAGFIGSNLAEELAKMGEVLIIDNLSTGKIENIHNLIDKKNVDFVVGSITDTKLLKETFDDADCIFHQAAIPSVQRSIENPWPTNEVNVNGTLNVLIAARDCGARKVVFASSSAIYGNAPELPKKEYMMPDPKSPYAISKLTGEYYCKVFSDIYGIQTVCLRYFNVYGPRQDPASEYAAVIPKFITRILSSQPPIIFGDGEQTRDFVFVKDVVKANILAMEKGAEGVFNIAFGEGISISELANQIMGIVGINLKPVYDAPQPGEIRDSLADISLARKMLEFEPDFNLTRGLEETIKWFSKD